MSVAPFSYRFNFSQSAMERLVKEDYIKSHSLQEIRRNLNALIIPESVLENTVIYYRDGSLQPKGDFQFSMSAAREAEL
jgi:hypothetical protein